jgi:predicted anti-sigma-YlaC factor YlaD
MNCTRAQEAILDGLDAVFGDASRDEVRTHLAGCEECRSFAERQRQLDAALQRCFPEARPGERFRSALERRLASERLWPEWLPDAGYLLGAGVATLACVLALPLPAASTWWIGGVTAGVGLFLQTIVAAWLEEQDQAHGA